MRRRVTQADQGIRRGLLELSDVQNVFSHIDSEFHSRLVRRVTQGHHDSGGEPGAASFWLLFLAAQEK